MLKAVNISLKITLFCNCHVLDDSLHDHERSWKKMIISPSSSIMIWSWSFDDYSWEIMVRNPDWSWSCTNQFGWDSRTRLFKVCQDCQKMHTMSGLVVFGYTQCGCSCAVPLTSHCRGLAFIPKPTSSSTTSNQGRDNNMYAEACPQKNRTAHECHQMSLWARWPWRRPSHTHIVCKYNGECGVPGP